MPGPLFLDTEPATAKLKVWELLPGEYAVRRNYQYHLRINGENSTHTDIVCPAHGFSKILSRTPTNAAYQSEYLQTSTLYEDPGLTFSYKHDPWIENRVFRVQNGEWSVWIANKDGAVMGKLTDLKMGGKLRRRRAWAED